MPGIFVVTWVCVCWTELGEKNTLKQEKFWKYLKVKAKH